MRTKSDRNEKTGTRVDAVAEWRSGLSGLTGAFLLFTSLSGLFIYLLPFSVFNQFNVIIHTLVGVFMLLPITWFALRHWNARKKGNLSHYQLLGYVSVAILLLCAVSGLVLTWQGLARTGIDYSWDLIHLFTGIGLFVFLLTHLLTVILRKSKDSPFLREIRLAQRRYYVYVLAGTVLMFGVVSGWDLVYESPRTTSGFTEDYNWRFGKDRPFAPSLARLDNRQWAEGTRQQVLGLMDDEERPALAAAFERNEEMSTGVFTQVRASLQELGSPPELASRVDAVFEEAAAQVNATGSVKPGAMAGSARCGSSGCHDDIYQEWLPSAHRYSALDDMFQRVQTLMSRETSPEHTRYCAGCHDPISLFSGAKNAGNITLSAEGANEGSSCLVCHSIVQADVQGNGDYTVRLPRRYVYEQAETGWNKVVSDFLIRTYPEQHIRSYSRSLYKTTEFCAACHKQYLDKEVNTDIGKVQGQNQYDSWKNSRWYHEDDPEKTIGCRECHMPLQVSSDPARGDLTDYNRSRDDGKHRSHRFLASNQYIPVLQDLEGAEQHVELTEKWMRGEIEIPEIADKWTTGPVVRLEILAPQEVQAGEDMSIRVILTNNKTGHDFPTGPLDMIESWIEVKVVTQSGHVVYHSGALNENGEMQDPELVYKADGFDRKGELIDRHNLWDLVGASYKRSLFPGATDAAEVRFQCPSMARGRLADSNAIAGERASDIVIALPEVGTEDELMVTAVLWYRKANPEFLDRVYGVDGKVVRSPLTEMSRASSTIRVMESTELSSRRPETANATRTAAEIHAF
jgi:hypothetical protein